MKYALTYLEKINKGLLSFGDMLLSLRETDELTQADLAKKLKVSRGLKRIYFLLFLPKKIKQRKIIFPLLLELT